MPSRDFTATVVVAYADVHLLCAAGLATGGTGEGSSICVDDFPMVDVSRSLEPELAIKGPYLSRLDEPGVGDGDRMERAIELPQPKAQKRVQCWEVRADIVVLPDESLQQRPMIGKPIQDMRGC